MCKYGESKMTEIMMATVPHVTSSSGLTKFLADGFLLDWVYISFEDDLSSFPGFHLEWWEVQKKWNGLKLNGTD
jgi:hypothetical protein